MKQIIRIMLALLAGLALATGVGAQQVEERMDPTHPVSLSVVKTTSTTDSKQVSAAGITFQARLITGINPGVDLRTLEPQKLLANEENLGAEYRAVTTATAGNEAKASFGQLPRGVYAVTEIVSRQGDVSMATVAPFLVSLPYFDGVKWQYDVEVKTKNQPIAVTKSADLTKAEVGQKVRYELRSTIPLPDVSGKLYRYILKDDLAPELSFRDGTVLELHTPEGHQTLHPQTDFILISSEKSFTVEFTDRGLKALTDARLSTHKAELRTWFDAEIVSAGVGHIPNTAVLYADGYTAETGGGLDSNTVTVEVTKPHTPGRETPTRDPLLPAIPGIPKPGEPPAAGQPPQAEQTVVEKAVEKIVGQAKKGMQSLAHTGANVYTLSIIAALALFSGAVIIRIQDNKRRKAEQ